MNEIKYNAFKALAVAIVLTLPIMFLVDSLIKEGQKSNQEEINNCLDTNTVCDPFPYLIYFLMPVPIIIYWVSFNYFERKRQKTWRSYN